jgi:hypothetical protein
MGPGCVKMGMFEVVSCRMGARQFDDVHASYPTSGQAALALYPQQRREVERRRMSELGPRLCVWQGGQDMRIMTIAFVLGRPWCCVTWGQVPQRMRRRPKSSVNHGQGLSSASPR